MSIASVVQNTAQLYSLAEHSRQRLRTSQEMTNSWKWQNEIISSQIGVSELCSGP